MPNNFYIPLRKNPRIAVVDLDSTLAYPTWSPDQKRSVIGDPIPENIEKLKELVANDYEIQIFTARHWGDRPMIMAWLDEHLIPYDSVQCGKPFGAVYVDDKAINSRDDSWFPVRTWK